MSIAVFWVSIAFSLLVMCRADWDLLKRGLPSLGLVVTVMYGLTYGVGWTLWRLDPSSLFGYGTASTLGALDRLGLLLALGLPALVCSYSLVRAAVGRKPQETFLGLSERHRPRLQRLSFGLVTLSVIGLLGMTATGLFLRDPQQQQQALQASWIAKFLIGTGLLSRLAPVGLVLVPFAWTGWSRWQRFAVLLLLSSWGALVLGSFSRGQLLALPLYLFLGSVIWRRLSLKWAALLLVLGGLLFLPLAEVIRVQREGDASNPALQRTFEAFQIGKQLMGTSHEFYLMLRADDCRRDLSSLIATDPFALEVYEKGVRSFPSNSMQRWHVVGLYQSCINRFLDERRWDGFGRLPLALLPRSLGFPSEGLFDGQVLSESLSSSLDLKPGEISYSTISLFADGWWRWRWPGVAMAGVLLGVCLSLIQQLLLFLQRRQPLAGLIGQLLVLSLVGAWINNTSLTMIWYLFWDFPKAWFELMVLVNFFGFRSTRGAI